MSQAAMYEPARETLRQGLEARADECGYVVTTKIGDIAADAIKDGDAGIRAATTPVENMENTKSRTDDASTRVGESP